MPRTKVKLTSLAQASSTTRSAIETLTEEQIFIAGLNAETDRDLVKYPPLEKEPISNMGIPQVSGPSRIRKWINRDYLSGPNDIVLTKNKVTLKTTYAQLKKLAGINS